LYIIYYKFVGYILLEKELMRKIWILILVIFATILSSQTFWYLESKVYCNLENKNVTIFMKNEEWTVKCQTYLDTIYQLALKKYNEISAIRSYIEQWDDVYYWKNILEEKKSEFLQLVNYRAQIKTAIDKFESALFDKYYDTLQAPMQIYYADLESQYYTLVNQDASLRKANQSLKLAQLEQQMWNVNHILNAKNLDDIMQVVSSYIYLKKQIEWK